MKSALRQTAKIGIMIEVPAISQLPLWQNEIDFISIGRNDPSQYLLALTEQSPRCQPLRPGTPAIPHEIHRICAMAKKLNLPVSLCGEMANDPVSVLILIGFWNSTFESETSHIPEIKALIRAD